MPEAAAGAAGVRTAMVLAAGEGQRMRPLTETTPKPLLPVGDRPLLLRTLDWLVALGFERIVVNTHHLGERVVAAVRDYALPDGVTLAVSPEAQLLGTGGGLHRALGHWLGDWAWVINGDVVCDIDMPALAAALAVAAPAARALMVVRPDPAAERLGPVYLDPEAAGPLRPVVGLLDHGRTAGPAAMFTGVHLLHRALVEALPEPSCVVRQGYRRWLDGGLVWGVEHKGYWNEIGTLDRYATVQADRAAGRLGWLGS